MKVPMTACLWTNPDGSTHGFASDDAQAINETYQFRLKTWPQLNNRLVSGHFVETDSDTTAACAFSLEE